MRTAVPWLRALVAYAALGVGIAVVPAATATAKNFLVPCDVAALEDAVEAAGFNGQEDMLWLAPGCVYPIASILIGYADAGFPLTVRGRGATLHGQDARTVFLVNPDAVVSFEDVTVTHGRAGAGATGDGGAFYVAGSLTLARSTVSESEAMRGGGLYIAEGGRVTLVDSTVSGNHAGQNGGGILNKGGRLRLLGSTVSGNTAAGQGSGGAGIYNDAWGTTAAVATLTNCTISGNASRFGAGVFNDEGTVVISHCTISHNEIVDGGNGGGIYHRNYLGGASLKIGNSVVANSVGVPDVGFECVRDPSLPTNTITRTGVLLIEDASCAVSGSWNGDPKLGPLAGSPAVHPLLPGSPLIDFAEPGRCPGFDQRGVPRPKDGNDDGNAICDVGAVEAP